MPTTYQERFGNNDDLIHAYANDNSPRASEIQYLYDLIKRLKARRVLNVPFEGNLLKSVATNEQVQLKSIGVRARSPASTSAAIATAAGSSARPSSSTTVSSASAVV